VEGSSREGGQKTDSGKKGGGWSFGSSWAMRLTRLLGVHLVLLPVWLLAISSLTFCLWAIEWEDTLTASTLGVAYTLVYFLVVTAWTVSKRIF